MDQGHRVKSWSLRRAKTWTAPCAGLAISAPICCYLESLGFAQNFLSSCELEALHFIGIGSFGEEFREDVVFRGIQEQFRKPLA